MNQDQSTAMRMPAHVEERDWFAAEHQSMVSG